ncbi:MAG TPA: crotonase/enoyl-CoA hydratase family protein [Caulobacteraceae bacterium]|nr:crotonase/enoyl-CoA hydratase family protein [Caulobacteraceae bacterium]
MADRVKVTMDRGVAEVRLNRPDKMNAIDGGMFEALIEAGEKLGRERGLRAVVMSGAGKVFSSGLDVATLALVTRPRGPQGAASRNPMETALEQRPFGIANRVQYAVWVWRELPVPVIAAVHGMAVGTGLQLTMGADIRIVAPDTHMAMLDLDWGLIPDMAFTQLVRHVCRDDVVRELMFSGRAFTGEAAVTMGLATRASIDPRGDALQLAHDIASKSPDAIRAAKRVLNAARVVDPATGLLNETEEQVALIGGANQIEAVKAHMEKRQPRFIE